MTTMPGVIELVERLVGFYEAGSSLVLVADYDGALTPLASSPRDAWLSPRTRRVLRKLAELPDVFIGISSGRSVDDLKQKVGLSGIYYAGTGGLELDLLGVRINHPLAAHTKPALESVIPRMNKLIAQYDGAWLEYKPLGLTLHYRELAARKAEFLTLATFRIVETAAGRLRVRRVDKGLEIAPDLDWNNGTALEFVLEDAARDAIPVYVSDPTCDRASAEAAHRRGGFVIRVGQGAAGGADVHLRSPGELVELFEALQTSITKSLAACFSGARRGA